MIFFIAFKMLIASTDFVVTGKAMLPILVQKLHEEYSVLTAEEKAVLIDKFTQHREAKPSSICVSTHSKINDITQTLNKVQNKVCLYVTMNAI